MAVISIKQGSMGISLTFGGNTDAPLTPAAGTPQDKPRKSYVYAHVTPDGNYFYIGKGIGDRARSQERHPLWHRYVSTRLNGQFTIVILEDNLSPEEAEELESEWIAQEGESLVNWINGGRQIDYEKLDKYHKLHDANKALMAKAKAMEKSDLDAACRMYIQAIKAIDEYVDIEYESGLVAQLLKEEKAEIGRNGEIEAIDRLSLCLIKLGKTDEAESYVRDYFKRYSADSTYTAAERINKRLEKALSKEAP